MKYTIHRRSSNRIAISDFLNSGNLSLHLYERSNSYWEAIVEDRYGIVKHRGLNQPDIDRAIIALCKAMSTDYLTVIPDLANLTGVQV